MLYLTDTGTITNLSAGTLHVRPGGGSGTQGPGTVDFGTLVATVPEPSSLVLIGVGLGAVVGLVRSVGRRP